MSVVILIAATVGSAAMPSSSDRRRLEVPTYLHERLVEIAIDEDRTVSSVAQEIVTLGLSQYESRGSAEPGADRLTDRARGALRYAEEEARRLEHRYVGTEHLLLGLIRETDGVAARVLVRLDLRLEEAREAVSCLVGRGTGGVSTGLPLVPRARRVLRLAEEEAERFEHAFVGTEHLLVGLIRVRDGVAARILSERGILHRAHAETLAFLLASSPATGGPESSSPTTVDETASEASGPEASTPPAA
ncbi:MAG TPA: Clp protease N-terminal domain-containing protein [Thermomicrobiaceae bacterium]|nr:Clp protease N-terminal domain-containing protein [Thermomicrobiaceae bacterium]